MRYEFRIIGPIAPAETIPLVIDLEEAKEHLEVDFAHHDSKITRLIPIAQEFVEKYTGQVLTPRVLELALDRFPSYPAQLEIAHAPVREILSISYTNPTNGAEVALAGADWRWSEAAPRLVQPAFNTAWPIAAEEFGSVRIRLEAGYDEGLAPASLIGAVKLMLTHLYEDSGALGTELPPGVHNLCRPYRRLLG